VAAEKLGFGLCSDGRLKIRYPSTYAPIRLRHSDGPDSRALRPGTEDYGALG
jgi:hypothetical protein